MTTAPGDLRQGRVPGPAANAPLERVLGFATAVPLFGIVALTFADVFARYLFASPIRGALEIIQFAMALTIFAALPLITRRREHVTVSLIDGLVRGATANRIKQLLCDAVSLVALGLIAWRLWIQAGESAASETATIVLKLPMAPLTYVMSGFAAVSAMLVALQCWQGLVKRGTHGAAAAQSTEVA